MCHLSDRNKERKKIGRERCFRVWFVAAEKALALRHFAMSLFNQICTEVV